MRRRRLAELVRRRRGPFRGLPPPGRRRPGKPLPRGASRPPPGEGQGERPLPLPHLRPQGVPAPPRPAGRPHRPGPEAQPGKEGEGGKDHGEHPHPVGSG